MPKIARLGDPSNHGGVIVSASSITFADGKGVARKGDSHKCPRKGHGTTAIVTGSSTTFADGKAVARVGDTAGCGASISDGSPTTYAN